MIKAQNKAISCLLLNNVKVLLKIRIKIVFLNIFHMKIKKC